MTAIPAQRGCRAISPRPFSVNLQAVLCAGRRHLLLGYALYLIELRFLMVPNSSDLLFALNFALNFRVDFCVETQDRGVFEVL